MSLLNDDGYLAFCESDFVVIPSGILLHYISGKPVFLNDPTFPHDNVVTLAHCTAPRKMDGKHAEPAKILTHFESDYGAAPKVEMKLGQVCTNLVPDFDCKKWVGFEGKIVGNPFLDICRSQIDVKIQGDGTGPPPGDERLPLDDVLRQLPARNRLCPEEARCGFPRRERAQNGLSQRPKK